MDSTQVSSPGPLGLNTSTVPVYVSETAGSDRRGSMVAVQGSIVIFGIVMAYWIDYGTVRNLTGEVCVSTTRELVT